MGSVAYTGRICIRASRGKVRITLDVAHQSHRCDGALHTNVDRSADTTRQSCPRRVLAGDAFECLEHAVLSARDVATDVRFDSSEHPG